MVHIIDIKMRMNCALLFVRSKVKFLLNVTEFVNSVNKKLNEQEKKRGKEWTKWNENWNLNLVSLTIKISRLIEFAIEKNWQKLKNFNKKYAMFCWAEKHWSGWFIKILGFRWIDGKSSTHSNESPNWTRGSRQLSVTICSTSRGPMDSSKYVSPIQCPQVGTTKLLWNVERSFILQLDQLTCKTIIPNESYNHRRGRSWI